MSDAEAQRLREYLLRGGFRMVDEPLTLLAYHFGIDYVLYAMTH